MKTKTSKQPKRSNPAVRLKDLKPKKNAGGGRGNTYYVGTANGGVWKTTDGG
jgi:hypothetical protein